MLVLSSFFSKLPESRQLYVIKTSLPAFPVVSLGDPALMPALIFTKLKEVWSPIQAKPLSLCPSFSLDLCEKIWVWVCVYTCAHMRAWVIMSKQQCQLMAILTCSTLCFSTPASCTKPSSRSLIKKKKLKFHSNIKSLPISLFLTSDQVWTCSQSEVTCLSDLPPTHSAQWQTVQSWSTGHSLQAWELQERYIS